MPKYKKINIYIIQYFIKTSRFLKRILNCIFPKIIIYRLEFSNNWFLIYIQNNPSITKG